MTDVELDAQSRDQTPRHTPRKWRSADAEESPSEPATPLDPEPLSPLDSEPSTPLDSEPSTPLDSPPPNSADIHRSRAAAAAAADARTADAASGGGEGNGSDGGGGGGGGGGSIGSRPASPFYFSAEAAALRKAEKEEKAKQKTRHKVSHWLGGGLVAWWIVSFTSSFNIAQKTCSPN